MITDSQLRGAYVSIKNDVAYYQHLYDTHQTEYYYSLLQDAKQELEIIENKMKERGLL